MNKYRFGIRVALDAIRHLREENINFNDNRKSYNDRKHLFCLHCFRNVKLGFIFRMHYTFSMSQYPSFFQYTHRVQFFFTFMRMDSVMTVLYTDAYIIRMKDLQENIIHLKRNVCNIMLLIRALISKSRFVLNHVTTDEIRFMISLLIEMHKYACTLSRADVITIKHFYYNSESFPPMHCQICSRGGREIILRELVSIGSVTFAEIP